LGGDAIENGYNGDGVPNAIKQVTGAAFGIRWRNSSDTRHWSIPYSDRTNDMPIICMDKYPFQLQL
jgi:hypothetical protein